MYHGECDKALRCVCHGEHKATDKSCQVRVFNENLEEVMAEKNILAYEAQKLLSRQGNIAPTREDPTLEGSNVEIQKDRMQGREIRRTEGREDTTLWSKIAARKAKDRRNFRTEKVDRDIQIKLNGKDRT